MIPWEAQLELVKALTVHTQVVQELTGVLKPMHFDNPALGWIGEAVFQGYAKYRTLPTEGQIRETLAELPEKMHAACIAILPDVLACQAPPAEWASKAGRRIAARAELRYLGAELDELANKGQFDAVLFKAKVAAQIAATRGEVTKGSGDMNAILARHTQNTISIPTGITRLDKCLPGGGLPRGSMGHILGKKGGGKSHALVHMGAQALMNMHEFRVLHVTCEMPAAEVRARYDRHITGLDGNDFLTAVGSDPSVLPRLKHAHDRLTILEATKKNLTVHGLESCIDRLDEPPDLVVVDYLQLLSPGAIHPGEDPTKARQAALGRMSMDLHVIAQERNVALWTAYQANREGIKAVRRGEDVLDTTHYAEAIAAAWPAEVIVSLNQNITEMASRTGRLFIAENRNGRSLVPMECFFYWHISKIVDLLDVVQQQAATNNNPAP